MRRWAGGNRDASGFHVLELTRSIHPASSSHVIRIASDPILTLRSTSNFGSDAMLVQSDRADQTGLEEIGLSPAIHLAFDELELGDLTLGLSVRTRQRDRGADRSFVFDDTAGERSHQ